MAITIKHGRPETLLTAAQIAGQERATQQQLERTERLQAQQREFEYKTALAQQSMSIDLEMDARARMWEIEKAEIASRVDFAREEQTRQRKLDSADNALQQIDKEVLAGRMTEQEARPLKLKYEMNKLGVDVPTSLLPTGDDEERYGVQPYWMRGRDAPEGSPERQLYESKMEQQISGQRTGTIPYYLNPEFLRELPSETAQDILMNKGIFFDSDEEFQTFLNTLETESPLDTKSLDMGVRVEGGGRNVLVISPTGEEGTIPIEDLEDALAEGYTQVREEPTDELVEEQEYIPQVELSTAEIAKQRAQQYKYPKARTLATMSPLRTLIEAYRAHRLKPKQPKQTDKRKRSLSWSRLMSKGFK